MFWLILLIIMIGILGYLRLSFKPFYEVTEAEDLTEPQHLYRLQSQLEVKQVFFDSEVSDYCVVYFAPKRKETVHDHAKMNGILDLAVERFHALDEEEQEAFKGLVIDRMEGNEDIFSRLMNDAEFRELAQDNLGQKLYKVLAQDNVSEAD